MTNDRKNGNGNGKKAADKEAEDKRAAEAKRAEAGRAAADKDINPVTGRKETHTRLATPEEEARMRKGELVEGRPGDEGDRKDAKGKKIPTDAEAAEKFADPANTVPEGKEGKSMEEGEVLSAEAQASIARRAALGS